MPLFKFNCYSSNSTDTPHALNEIEAQLNHAHNATFLIVYFDVQLNAGVIWQWLSAQFENTQFILSSSCQGSFCHNEYYNHAFATLTLISISDPSGCYFVSPGKRNNLSTFDTAQSATNQLLKNTFSESPELLWITLSPGDEEQAIAGIQAAIGQRVPIIGGSASDNDVSGQWQVYTHHTATPCSMAIASLTPSVAVSFSFSSGYAPSGLTTKVTQAYGRNVATLDNTPAAIRYNQLTNGTISQSLKGGNILGLTSFHPIGREVSKDEYLLSHPENVHSNGTLSLFSSLDEGDVLHIMHGSTDSLLRRAHQVIHNAQHTLDNPALSGCMLIYCAGCMLSVKSQFEQVTKNICQDFNNVPVAGVYTFGEQGCFLDGQSRHGNLMISALVFGVTHD